MKTTSTLCVLSLSFATLAGVPACVGADSESETVDNTSAAVSGSSIASIAAANLGKGACSTNSTGGHAFDSSCTGNGGLPEYWCADFARWVWAAAGANTSGLTAGAGSFYVYGQNHGTLSHTPHVGDAVVFDYQGGGYADHVAIVTQVNSDGTIESISGDWNGQSGSEAHFASTSHVVKNAPAYAGRVGDHPGVIGMTISGFISPAPSGPAPDACSESAGYCTDTLQCLNGHWIIRQDDPNACVGGYHNVQIACHEGNGYCTPTLQCRNGVWVNRLDDPDPCTQGTW